MSASANAQTVADNGDFSSRVRHFLTKAAVSVMSEVGSTPSHAERVIYAKKVLDGTASVAQASRAVVTNATIQAAIQLGAADFGVVDGDIEFVVNSLFNALAGVATS
jgi:hypothetical protein